MLNATNEIVTADAAADNNSNSSSEDISDMTSHSHALIDSRVASVAGNLPVSYVLTGNLPVTYHQ